MSALTMPRQIALYQILEVPFSATHQILNDDGSFSIQKIAPSQIAAYNTIQTYLTNSIYTNPTLQTVLEGLLDKWITLGTRVDSMEGGSIGSLNGISWSPEKERAEISKQVIIIVPYYRLADQFKHANDGNIAIVR